MLTEQQINEITTLCQAKGVQHYDVQMELVDHIAGMVDHLQEEKPDQGFHAALQMAIGKFAPVEFQSIVKNKEMQLLKRFNRLWLKEFLAYFTFPKIMLTIFLTLIIISINHFFNVGEFSNFIGLLIPVFGFFNIMLLKIGDTRIPKKNLIIRPLFPLLIHQTLMIRSGFMLFAPYISYIFWGIIADILKGFLRSKGYTGFSAVKVDVILYPLPLFVVSCLAWRNVFVNQIILMRKQYAAAYVN